MKQTKSQGKLKILWDKIFIKDNIKKVIKYSKNSTYMENFSYKHPHKKTEISAINNLTFYLMHLRKMSKLNLKEEKSRK